MAKGKNKKAAKTSRPPAFFDATADKAVPDEVVADDAIVADSTDIDDEIAAAEQSDAEAEDDILDDGLMDVDESDWENESPDDDIDEGLGEIEEEADESSDDDATDEDEESGEATADDDTRSTKAVGRRKPVDHESFAHRLYVSDFNIAFVEKKRIWFIISGVLLVVCVLSLVFRGLNLGIDFTGGSKFTIATAITDNEKTVTEYTDVVNAVGLPEMGDLRVTIATTGGQKSVVVETRTLTTDEATAIRAALATQAKVDPTTGVNYTAIGPSWGGQLTQKGLQAVIIFLVLVALMIGLYFRNWKMSLAALIGLFHDMIVVIGIYSLVGFTVSPATITGVLTILGYSLYDNVVVFDKVRENTVGLERKDFTFSQAADLAVNQVFVRSINTTIVGVLPVLALLTVGVVFLGGQGPLPDLGLAMFVGMITGAWSSIFIATPILTMMREAEPAMRLHREGIERRLGRAQTRMLITSTVTDQAPELAGAVVTAAPVPVRHAPAAGRPQPARTSRSQRKG